MDNIVETLTNPDFLIAVFSAVAAFATVITLGAPMLQRDQLKARMKNVSTHREELRQKQREELSKKSGSTLRTQSPANFVRNTVEKLNLRELLDEGGARKKLMMAGFRGQGPVLTYMFFRFAMPFMTSIAVLIYLYAVSDFGLAPMARLGVTFGAFVIGFYLPNVYVENVIAKRQEAIMQSFPDALDLLLICVESGMSIEAAFTKVAQEVGANSIELAEELSLTTAELSYLQDRKIAYQNFADRTGLDGTKAVATALVQAERYGTPLGQALRVLAQENRELRMQAAEKKAASLPAKLTVPMIAFFLPVLFIVIIGPSVLSVMSIE
ncbi:MAG: type II secretion system F family protein [Pseudomonadota bacterium]